MQTDTHTNTKHKYMKHETHFYFQLTISLEN